MLDDAWTGRLPKFDGQIAIEGKWLDIAELDFGKVRRQRPFAVLKPANTDDVVKAVNFCREEKIPLALLQMSNSRRNRPRLLQRPREYRRARCKTDLPPV